MQTRAVTKARVTFRVADDPRYREFWDWYETDEWEPDTLAVFARFLRPGSRYVDLGAWIGPTVLLAAATAASVVCVEPDPVARDALERNLELNPEARAKTTVVAAAAGANAGVVLLAAEGAGGDSTSSVVGHTHAATTWTVPQVAAAELLREPAIGPGDLVKVDVEGAEYAIVPSLAADLAARRPHLYVSFHPNLVFDKTSVRARVASGVRALRLNRRLLRTLLLYRHHYVWDEGSARFRDVRRRNLLRVMLPLPLRASFAIGAAVFTDDEIQPQRRLWTKSSGIGTLST